MGHAYEKEIHSTNLEIKKQLLVMNEMNDNSEQKVSGGFMSRFGKRLERKEMVAVLYGGHNEDAESPREAERPFSAPAVGMASPSPRSDMSSDGEKNVFTSGLVIEGNVTSDSDIVIRGVVKGNVSCRGEIELNGEITGDVEGKNIRITGGSVRGNIRAGEMLSIDRSRIKGNLWAAHARINNPIEGDISVQGTLTLQREANIQGNIMAAGLSVEEGASMNGQITISRERTDARQVSRGVSAVKPASASRPSSKPAPVAVEERLTSSPGEAVKSDDSKASTGTGEGRLPLDGKESCETTK